MTLDELITKAQELRKELPGDTLVGVWPYDGQEFHIGYFTNENITLNVYKDQKIWTKFFEDAIIRTVIMLDG